MEIASHRRVWIAFIVAPIVTVLTLTGCAMVGLVADGQPVRSTIDGAGHATFFFAFFGLPIAYTVELCVGFPLYQRWKERPGLRRRSVVAVSSVVGAGVMPLVWAGIWGSGLEWQLFLIGAFMGFAAGGTFVAIAFRSSISRPAI